MAFLKRKKKYHKYKCTASNNTTSSLRFFFFLPSLHNSFNRSVTREEKKDNRTDGYERTRA